MYFIVQSQGGTFLGRVRRYGIVEGGMVLGTGSEVSKDSLHSQYGFLPLKTISPKLNALFIISCLGHGILLKQW